jgi:hypothetical protein
VTERRWEFELDVVRHAIELEHQPRSSKRSIRVDGRLLSLPSESRQPKERNTTHTIRLEGHTCEVVISYQDRRFAYDLTLDGAPNTPEVYSREMTEALGSERVRTTRWTAIGLFLLVGIGGNWLNWYFAHTKGYFFGLLAALAPAFVFLALYFMVFPKDFVVQYTGKFPLRMWLAIIPAFLIGFANFYTFENGLY